MSMSADIRQELVEKRIGMTRDELFGATGAPNEKNFAALLSSLKGSGKIKVGGERGGVPYYVIVDWPESSLRERSVEDPKQHRISAKEFAAEGGDAGPAKARAKGARTPNVIQAEDGPQPSDGGAAYAINEGGVLGIEKGETKIKLEAGEFARLRKFIEKSEEIWKPEKT